MRGSGVKGGGGMGGNTLQPEKKLRKWFVRVVHYAKEVA